MLITKKKLKLFLCTAIAVSLFSCENDTEEIAPEINSIESETLNSLEQQIASGEKVRSGKTVIVNDRNAATFATTLINAVYSAGWGGTVQLGSGDFYSNREIILPAGIKVTIKGAGKHNTNLKLTQNRTTSGFLILTTNGTSIQEMTVNAQGKTGYGACAVNTNGAQDVYMYRVGFSNSSIGTGTPDNAQGLTPAGMYLDDCSFYNCDHGINFVRLWGKAEAPWVKKMTIKDCWFGGTQSAGISIDCGNDGIDGNPVFGSLRSVAAQNTVTNFDGTLITGCTFEKASKYNIAIAKAWNIDIEYNTLKGNTGTVPHGEAINIEHEAHNITIKGNYISNEGLANQDHSYISILSFRDYQDSRRQELGFEPSLSFLGDGCRNITIDDNTFKGNIKYGIIGEYAENITIKKSTFNTPQPTEKFINFWVKSKNIWHWDNGTNPSQVSIVN